MPWDAGFFPVTTIPFPSGVVPDLLLLAVSLAVLFLLLDRVLPARSGIGRGLLGVLLVGVFLLGAGLFLSRPGKKPAVTEKPAVTKPASVPTFHLLRLGSPLLPGGFLPGPAGGHWVFLLPPGGAAEVRSVDPEGRLGGARSLPGIPTALAAAPDGSALAALPAAPGAEILRITGGAAAVTPLPRIVSRVEALLPVSGGLWLGYLGFDGRMAVGLFRNGVLSRTVTVPAAGIRAMAGGGGRLFVLSSGGGLYEVSGEAKAISLPDGVRGESLIVEEGEPTILGCRAGSSVPLRLLRLSGGTWRSLAFGRPGETPGELEAGRGGLLLSFTAKDRPGFGEIVDGRARLRVFDLGSAGLPGGGGGDVYPAADGGFWGAVPSSGVLIRGKL